MAGQGRPPNQNLLRAARCVAVLVLIPCALVTSAAAQDVELHLRASWGGGVATTWSGSLSLSAGSLAIENVLGLESDAAGIAVPVDERTLRLTPRTARAYDGLDVVVRAPREAVLRLEFTSAANPQQPVSFEVPLAEMIGGRTVKQLDDTGNRFAVHRTPGDLLRFESGRSHLVFESGESLQAALTPHLIETGKSTSIKCSLRLVSAATRANVWQKEEDITLDEFGSGQAIPLEFDLPEEEGVYELVAELYARRFGAPLLRGKLLAERQVQFVVVGAAPRESENAEWAAVGDFDPAQPRWWERLMRQPTMKIIPGWSQGPVGSEPTGKREHLGQSWSTLKANAWQAYPLPVSEIGLPHILEIDFPSDVPQTLAISLIEPNAAGLVVPLGVDSGIDVQSSASRPPETLTHRVVFWPRTHSPLMLLANRRSNSPAIFGKVRILAGPARLASPVPAERQTERLVAAYFDKPLFPENFSVTDSLDVRSNRPVDDWSGFFQGGTRLADYLRWSGHNAAVVNVLCEGSSLYPSATILPTAKYDMGAFSSLANDPQRKDVLELLLRLFDREQLQLIPALSFASPLPELEELLATSTPRESEGIELIGTDGRRWIDANSTRRGSAPYYNLLDRRVQAAMRRVVLELTERYAAHRALAGIAIQVSGEGYAQLPDDASGLDDVTLNRFVADCRLELPEEDRRRPSLRWEWIQREARDQWLAWRAKQVTGFYRQLADEVHAIHPELQLLLCPTDPFHSRRVASRVRPQLPPQDHAAEGLLQVGLDPEQLRQIPGLTFVRPRMVEPSPVAANNPVWSELNTSAAVDRMTSLFASPAALQLAEPLPLRLESFDKVSPFGPQNTYTHLLSHVSPVSAEARKRFIRSLAAADVHTLLDGGQMLTLGQEDNVRELLQVLSAIPAEPFETVPSAAANSRTQPVTMRRWSDESGTWFYLVNDSPWPVIVDVDLASSSALALSTVGPNARQLRLPPTAGSVHWKQKLQPYQLVAARTRTADVQVENWRTQVDPTVDTELRDHIRDIRLRANLLRSQEPLQSLVNSGFENPGAAGQIANWSSAAGPGITVEVDRRDAKEGRSCLHIVSRRPTAGEAAPVVWVRSDTIPTPTTGRLAVSAWLKTPDARRQPKLRLAIEGQLDGQPYYRRANVGASEDDRETQPLQQQWSEIVFPINDLPATGLTDLQIGFDLMGEGDVWIDQVQVFDLWFNPEDEQGTLLKSAYLADFQVQEGKVGDALHFVESYWPQFLRRHVPLEPQQVATLPERSTTPLPAANAPAQPEGWRRWLPRLPFGK